jgi:uncharacterized membrane protein
MSGDEVTMATPLSFHDERPENRGNTNTRQPDHEYQYGGPRRDGGGGGAMKGALIALAVLSLIGIMFSMTSTSDFISHLDRQVHSIHCSILPGAKAEVGESGCRTVMMSPYSSVLRSSMWGGIPISLLSVATFAYLLMRSLSFALSKSTTKKHTMFLIAATGLPVLMSIIYGSIAYSQLGAACTVCIGIYVVSGLMFFTAIFAHINAPADDGAPAFGLWARWFGEGCVYVAIMVAFYVMFAPTSTKSAEGCGTLVTKDPMKTDTLGLFITMSKGASTTGLAVLDPLCPACKGFDERIMTSGIDQKVALSAVLFPLDSTCNWMVKESLHPGACAVSEAMLCDREKSLQILDWAFAEQERLRTTAKSDEAAVRRELEEKFPWVKGCLGTAAVKNKVNKSLRFAVQNALPLLTPQLFIGDKRVCDEDTDLGLEFAVDQMLKSQGALSSSSPGRTR